MFRPVSNDLQKTRSWSQAFAHGALVAGAVTLGAEIASLLRHGTIDSNMMVFGFPILTFLAAWIAKNRGPAK